MEDLKAAKERAPNRLEASLALGNAYLAQERYEAAAKEFRDLLESHRDLPEARDQLAKALPRGRALRYEEAEAVLRGPSIDAQ